MRYKKRPVVVEAFRLGIEEWSDWFNKAVEATPPRQVGRKAEPGEVRVTYGNDQRVSFAAIETLEGRMIADWGDWIVKGIVDEVYPVKHVVFVGTYDALEE